MGLIAKAKEDPRLASVLSELSGAVKLKYRKSQSDSWGSELVGQTAVISYQKCGMPAAALCHELLHVQIQVKGYRRVKIGFSTYERSPLFASFLTCLDNELQHHKFYQLFLAMGFDPESFYCDSDVDTEAYLRDVLKKRVGKLIEILPDFLTLIAPGGSMTAEARMQLLNSFLSLDDGKVCLALTRIKAIVGQWAASDSLDNVPVYKEIMLVLQPKPNYTWFGFDANDRPPQQGFFVDQVFEVV